jgi:hypothetical protein
MRSVPVNTLGTRDMNDLTVLMGKPLSASIIVRTKHSICRHSAVHPHPIHHGVDHLVRMDRLLVHAIRRLPQSWQGHGARLLH